ncbi:hypothetical protein ASE90_05305 [Sphingomonas sp. Leaf67]|uniref:hypothetical protein n=1 Tax=Sphingomonas sp. Leaf67 TaxID=1736230 RepID=UPI0006F1DE55|nr:hypothetical protein [Sphingomonas sp. Leaf67]KQN92146.1 hypothetical protein ASE90_05305 [Sphingomonas sp. Leaf67]
MSAPLLRTLDEIGRLGLTHGLDPAALAAALGVESIDVGKLIDTGCVSDTLLMTSEAAAAYLLGILVRLEVRCHGYSVAIRAALDRPSPDLGGLSIARALLARPDIAGLAVIHEAAGTLPVPRVRMWRVAGTYS